MKEPLSEYYNNPGAIKPPNGKPDFYEGQFGVDEQGFAIFTKPEFGKKALLQDINAKLKRNLDNPQAFVNEYTKGDDPEKQATYAIFLAGQLGLSSTADKFPKDSAEKIADAVAKFESGKFGKPSAAAPSSPSTEETSGQPTDQQRRDKLIEEIKALPGKVYEEYPTASRVAFDIAGAETGRRLSVAGEMGRREATRAAAELNRQQRLAAQAAAQASTQAAAPGTTPVPEGGTPGEKWARKVVGQEFVKPGVQSVTEATSDYRRAVPQGKIAQRLPKMFNMPHLPSEGQPMSIADRLIAQRQAAEQAAIEAQQAAANQPQPRQPSPLSRGAQATSRGVNIGYRAFPGAAGALAGLGTAELGQQAYSRFSKGDVPGGILASVGAGSSALSLFPFPVTRVPSALLAVASPLALLAYDKMKERAVSQAEGYGALAAGQQLPAPSIYSGYTSP